jgi:hypothetical protein
VDFFSAVFDAFTSIFYTGQADPRRRSPGDTLAAAIALFVLPLVEVAITLIWHLKDPTLVCIWLPLAFGVLTYFVMRALTRVTLSLWLAIGCAATCFLWGCCIFVLNLLTWNY